VIERDNLEIIWAIRAATSTTVSALRAAQLAVQAVSDRSHAAATAVSDSMALRDTITQLVDAIDEVDRRRRTTIEDVQGRPRP
jgi:hypothetical protein